MEVVENAKRLQEAYSNDIEASLSEELLQFSAFLNTDFVKKKLEVTATSHPDRPSVPSSRVSDDKTVKQDDDDVEMDVESLELRMYRLLVTKNLETVFPNTIIALRIYLSLMISNCSGERSFSKLKLIKSQLRSCMTQKRLNNLVRLGVESDLLRQIDMSSVINEFALKKSRKHVVLKT